jgi:hypothetical protein
VRGRRKREVSAGKSAEIAVEGLEIMDNGMDSIRFPSHRMRSEGVKTLLSFKRNPAEWRRKDA